MTQSKPDDELPDEFRRLSQNLKEALQAALNSEESRRLQRELKVGLSALEAGLREATNEFGRSETGQRLKAEVDDFGERVRRGQVEEKIRADLLGALRSVNEHLAKYARPTAETSGEPKTPPD